MYRKTSFGHMETILEREGQVISELLYFKTKGRSHLHDSWENCCVTAGSGTIVIGKKAIEVKQGSTCKIPPHTDHWMVPDAGGMEVLLVYSTK